MIVSIFVHAVRVWILLLAAVFVYFFFRGDVGGLNWIIVIASLTYSITAGVEAVVVGLDTMRGRFILLLSLMGMVVFLTFLLNSHVLHVLLRLMIAFAVGYMFYNLKFRLGIPLGRGRIFVSFLLFMIIFLLILQLVQGIHVEPYKYLMLFLDVVSFILVVFNTLMYIGGDIEKVWIAGIVVVMLLIIGDLFFIMDVSVRIYLLLWFLPLFLMNHVALRVIQE